ncbi:MAG: ATP-binding cassette domain-containing protein, partial [Verrucomicrobiota bacterium]
GELSSRLAADLSLVRDTLVSTAPQFIRQSVMLVAGLTFLFILSPKLAFFMLACLPAALLFIAFFGFRIRGASRDAQDRLAETNVVLDETLHGIADVKAFANEEHEVSRYGKGIDHYLQAAFQLIQGRALMVAFIIFVLFGLITLIVWFGARLLVAGDIDQAKFMQFCLVTAFIAGAFASLPEIVSEIQKAVGATDRLREILEQEQEGHAPADAPEAPVNPALGDLDFRSVSFAYPSRSESQVLKDVSFSVESGQRIALVGPSGAGKSTLISLLLRFYDPSEGELLLDGKPLTSFPLTWLRKQMAVVPQEVLLFGDSIRNNIAYGDPSATDEEIREAASRAYADKFIEELPDGYDTFVGERGMKLSGGQRQRIAIARAILANPSVLLLDEATSALDAESERLVQQALDDLMRDRTSIIIAHRLATVRSADQILVLDKGNIVQRGTHDVLSEEAGGIYQMLAKLQFT